MAIVCMVIMTVLAVFFLVEIKRADRVAAAEIVLSKAWSNQFSRQELTEKKEEYLKKNTKYHTVTEKKQAKRVKEWDKQIAEYQKKEEEYMSGKKFSMIDTIPLFGYQFLTDIKLDSDSKIFQTLVAACEHSGYVRLERTQETGEKRNSVIYASYLLASLFSFVAAGGILASFLGVLMIVSEKEISIVLLSMLVGLILLTLFGYIPYDNLRTKAMKRQEELNESFPDAISKITLLVTAGMSLVNAIEETANSDSSLINREFRIVVQEMNQAATLQGALVRMQCRCDNKYLDKMITIVAKSYTEGNRELADHLRVINEECWLDKKHSARRMGEAVQNKLFIPTMLMFIGILVTIVLPAMAGFAL